MAEIPQSVVDFSERLITEIHEFILENRLIDDDALLTQIVFDLGAFIAIFKSHGETYPSYAVLDVVRGIVSQYENTLRSGAETALNLGGQ